MAKLSGKTVVVTGASKGIGAAITAVMVQSGARVIAHYGSDILGVKAAVSGAVDGQVTLLKADFSDMEAVRQVLGRGTDSSQRHQRGSDRCFGQQCRNYAQSGGIFDPLDDWDKVWAEAMTVNVHAPARLLRYAVADWIGAGVPGAIIGIGSWTASRGTTNPGAIAYAASKAAIVAATKTVARNYAAQGILAYVISPGVVRTQMSLDSAAKVGGEEAVTATLPMAEWVPPNEIGELAVFLSEGRARHPDRIYN